MTEDNKEFSVDEKDDSVTTTETKGMILDTVTDTQEDRIPKSKRKIPGRNKVSHHEDIDREFNKIMKGYMKELDLMMS